MSIENKVIEATENYERVKRLYDAGVLQGLELKKARQELNAVKQEVSGLLGEVKNVETRRICHLNE